MKRMILFIPLFFALFVNAHAGNDPILVIDTGRAQGHDTRCHLYKRRSLSGIGLGR